MKSDDSLGRATRASLIDRLQDWDDNKSWQDFFETYWHLIYSVALKSGLSDAEAQDVVQEVVISVSKKIRDLKYDPALGSFKAWLMTVTRWRIVDQFRTRPAAGRPREADDSRRTDVLERLPDPRGVELDAVWDREWQENCLRTAVLRVKKQVSPHQYQIFDCYVIKGWPVKDVTRTLGISSGQVYLAKHRVGRLLKRELKSLSEALL